MQYIYTLRFTCDERKIRSNIKKFQNIVTMIAGMHERSSIIFDLRESYDLRQSISCDLYCILFICIVYSFFLYSLVIFKKGVFSNFGHLYCLINDTQHRKDIVFFLKYLLAMARSHLQYDKCFPSISYFAIHFTNF